MCNEGDESLLRAVVLGRRRDAGCAHGEAVVGRVNANSYHREADAHLCPSIQVDKAAHHPVSIRRGDQKRRENAHGCDRHAQEHRQSHTEHDRFLRRKSKQHGGDHRRAKDQHEQGHQFTHDFDSTKLIPRHDVGQQRARHEQALTEEREPFPVDDAERRNGGQRQHVERAICCLGIQLIYRPQWHKHQEQEGGTAPKCTLHQFFIQSLRPDAKEHNDKTVKHNER